MRKVFISLIFLPILLPFSLSANIFEYSRNGNDFSSASGSYATSTHCVFGQTCGWISGNQAIVGVYYADPNTWGGTVRWDFNIDIPLASIKKAEVMVEWPHLSGKGLHSPDSTGWGSISVKSAANTIATLNTNVNTCAPTYDYYAHACGIWYVKYDVPLNLIETTTKVYVQTGSRTAWDVMKVTLFLYTSEGNVKIVNGKIYVDGKEFLVKGIDYAPWIKGTGPDPTLHNPFPNEYNDVTNKVTTGGNIYIIDYNMDGRIKAWEVIQYDLEMMKGIGANTIRTYASGEWHDKNLDGNIDISEDPEQNEIVQGDLPNWMLDRIVSFCESNNMKVIIGYWVQEENFNPGKICNWDDLEVAKDTMRRIIDRYSSSPAVLAWGIGNEVHGIWNHEWFTWGVNINDYLNSLYTYVRSIDNYAQPIMYAKYVGENANFNTLSAEIISINSFKHSAEELIAKGEFSIPAPTGKAYMIGEYGHIIEHAIGHWDLSKQYAGGCFLEYNNVWWKGEEQSSLGIVDMYRKIRPERYDVVYSLYLGKSEIIAGHGQGAGGSWVKIFDEIGTTIKQFESFGAGNANGEVSVAQGDVTGDGIPEIVVGHRSLGAASYVRVFTKNATLLWTFKAFGSNNVNGMVNVAIGDVDLDGVGEIVVAQGPGGQSYVRIFEYGNATPVTTWRAFGSGNTSGEVSVAAGQTASGASVEQIITGQGHGGQSYVRVWDYDNPPTLRSTFKAFGGGNTSGGVDVGVGCFDDEPGGRDLIVVGQGGPGQTAAAPAGSYIMIFTEGGIPLQTIKAFGGCNLNGRVTVSGGQADGDAAEEIIVGQAVGGNSYWRAFNYNGSLIRTVKAFGNANTSGQIDVAGHRN